MKSFVENSKSNVSSNTPPVTGSNQSLGDTANRTTKPDLSKSRTSINSEQKPKDETPNTSPTKASDKQNKTSMCPTWSSG